MPTGCKSLSYGRETTQHVGDFKGGGWVTLRLISGSKIMFRANIYPPF